jgi:iron complex outermembrane receptor protein
MRARAERGLVSALALLAAAGVLAQAEAPEPSLEELMRQGLPGLSRRAEVSTAARQAQSADRAPTLTYVLTDEDIRAQGWRNLTDVLNQLPGLFISSNGSFSYVGARGLGRPGDFNARVLLLIDGMRANENIYDAAQVGAEFPWIWI